MIQFQDVNFHYKKRIPLFKELNLDIETGNIYGLLGKNGAGKTSLLKLIGGLLFPKSGVINAMGFNPSERFPAFLSDLFFMPEELHIPAMKVSTFAKVYAPFYPKFSTSQFENYLRDFEISADQKLNGFSPRIKSEIWVL